MVMRLMRLCWWIGHSGVMAMMAAQLGLATMPLWPAMAPALISGITSGTSGSMRKAEELSTTMAPRRDRDGGVALRDAAARREERDVDALEALLGQLLHHQRPAVERQFAAHRAGGGEQPQLLHREAALGQAAQELDANGAGRADDCRR